ncbi:MAG: septum formation initiator family protein [Clostridia bacterium]|nr:septum formation initiator family protein [Clostridia bacterium]
MAKNPIDQPKKRGIGILMRLFMLLILIVSAGVFVVRMIDYAELSRQREQLKAEKAQYEQTIEELNYRLNSPIDYDDIIRIAREKLGLAFPDETVYYSEQDNGGK